MAPATTVGGGGRYPHGLTLDRENRSSNKKPVCQLGGEWSLGRGCQAQPPFCLNIVLPASSEQGVITARAVWSAEKPHVTNDLLARHLK